MATALRDDPTSFKFFQADNVQTLSSKLSASSAAIPDRFIRPEVDPNNIVQLDTDLPIIDFAKLQDPQFSEAEIEKLSRACREWGIIQDPQFSEAEIEKLSRACREWGIIQLINHEVDGLKEVKADSMAFFHLPLEEKMVVAIDNGVEGYGQHFIVSNEQKLDWSDILALATHPVEARNFRFWPTNPPTFRDSFDKYSSEMNRLTRKLLEAFSKDLGIKTEEFLELFEGQPQDMRINYYPPCPQPDKALGLSAHTDGTAITLLQHVNEVQGLQLERDGKWLSVNVRPEAFVVFIGDVLEIMTNGTYKSTNHRAAVNPTERMTVACFQHPNRKCTVGPLPAIVKGGKAHYKSLPYDTYFKGYFSDKLKGTDYKESLKI